MTHLRPELRAAALTQAALLAAQSLEPQHLAYAWLIFGGQLVGLGLAFVRPRGGFTLVAALGLVQCVQRFPGTGNHVYLGALVMLLCALLLTDDADDQHHLFRCLVVLPAVAFFWAGIEKLVHGYWFRGQFIAHTLPLRLDIRASLAPFIDEEVLRRLLATPRSIDGAGPFELTSPLWLVASNMVWVGEIAVPLLALSRSVRRFWWGPALAGIWAVQWVAHEWMFGFVLTNLILLGAPARVRRIGVGLVVVGALVFALYGGGVLSLPSTLLPTIERLVRVS